MTATTFIKWLVKVGTQILLYCLFNTFACKYISMTLLQVLLHLFFVLGVHTICGQTAFAWPKGLLLIRWAFEPWKLGRHWGRNERRNRALRLPPIWLTSSSHWTSAFFLAWNQIGIVLRRTLSDQGSQRAVGDQGNFLPGAPPSMGGVCEPAWWGWKCSGDCQCAGN